MTEDQHLVLLDVGNSFYDALSVLAADHIAQLPKECQTETTEYLQEICSIYGSVYDKYLPGCRAKRGTT